MWKVKKIDPWGNWNEVHSAQKFEDAKRYQDGMRDKELTKLVQE